MKLKDINFCTLLNHEPYRAHRPGMHLRLVPNASPPVTDRPDVLFVSITTMKQFSVLLALCTIMASSRAHPHNSTCEHKRLHCTGLIGEFCPQCDADGNFLPQQCWASTGHCWCVDIYSGMEMPDTNTPPGVRPVECSE